MLRWSSLPGLHTGNPNSVLDRESLARIPEWIPWSSHGMTTIMEFGALRP